MTLEEKLTGWAGTSSATKQKKQDQDRTEQTIREAIRAHDAFDSCSLRIYAKRSYANNTSVRANSDVDIAVPGGTVNLTAHCPRRLFPTANAVPSVRSPTECQSPQDTAAISRQDCTSHCPSALRPAATTERSARSPRVRRHPALAATTPRQPPQIALTVAVPFRGQHSAVRSEADSMRSSGVGRRVHIACRYGNDVGPLPNLALLASFVTRGNDRSVTMTSDRVSSPGRY